MSRIELFFVSIWIALYLHIIFAKSQSDRPTDRQWGRERDHGRAYDLCLVTSALCVEHSNAMNREIVHAPTELRTRVCVRNTHSHTYIHRIAPSLCQANAFHSCCYCYRRLASSPRLMHPKWKQSTLGARETGREEKNGKNFINTQIWWWTCTKLVDVYNWIASIDRRRRNAKQTRRVCWTLFVLM